MGHLKNITGPGITDSAGVYGTDLGIARWDEQRGCQVLLFGDTFSEANLQGDWRSPVILCYNNDFDYLGTPGTLPAGPQTIHPRWARQLWPYPHNNDRFSTVLPTDFVKIDDWWYVYVMVTKGLGNEVWSEFQRSKDLVAWEHTGKFVFAHEYPEQIMLTFDIFGEWVIIYGTGGLARNKPIYMWRCSLREFPHGRWEPWGFIRDTGWAWGQPATPVLPGHYGELCLRNMDGNAVLTYFNAKSYSCEAKVLPSHDVPSYELNWITAPTATIARGADFPQLYGGYVSPLSKLGVKDGMKYIVSQWNTTTNDPYHSMLFEGTLGAERERLLGGRT